jgi:hypothetical protein
MTLLPTVWPWKRTLTRQPPWSTLGGWLQVWTAVVSTKPRGGARRARWTRQLQRHLLEISPALVETEVDLVVLDKLTWTLTDPNWRWTWRAWAGEPALASHRQGLLNAADRRRRWLYQAVDARRYWPAVWLSRVLPVVRQAMMGHLSEGDLTGFIERLGTNLLGALEQALSEGRPTIWYASGTNHAGEVRGYAAVGQPIGVTAPDVSKAVERSLLQLAGTKTRVFVDSGAFGEFTRGMPITEAEWERRLTLYARLAESLKGRLVVVAPDKVGDQDASLKRLSQHRYRMRYIQQLGAQVIVPLQVGSRSLVEIYDEVWKLLRCPFSPGLPANKATLGEMDLVDLLEQRKPERVHFLGLGPRTRRRHGRRLLEIARTRSPGTWVSMDSALRKALVGRASGLRPLTAAEDHMGDELIAGSRSGMEGQDAEGWGLPDYTDHIATPSSWLTPGQLRAIATELHLRGEERGEFLQDPDGYLQRHCWGELPEALTNRCHELEPALEAAWDRLWRRLTTAEKKQRAVEQVLARGVAKPSP